MFCKKCGEELENYRCSCCGEDNSICNLNILKSNIKNYIFIDTPGLVDVNNYSTHLSNLETIANGSVICTTMYANLTK